MKKLLQIFVNTLEPAETYTHTHTHTHTHTCNPCQIIKQIGTICLMLISFFISPTFATEITDPATCDSGTLSTDTGPTNLRANYESNTLNLKWYDDDYNRINVSSTSSDSCTYGGKINLPTPPTKRGYTFKGWKVLPYTLIEYIESTGTQYIDTGFKFTGNIVTYDLVFYIPTSIHNVTLFGASNTNTAWSGLLYYYGGGCGLYVGTYEPAQSVYGLNNQGLGTKNTYSITVDRNNHKWKLSINGSINQGSFLGAVTNTTNIVLFGHRWNSSYVNQLAAYKNYGFKITQDGIVVRDFIPVKDSNGVACMYDKVSGNFFYNAGTGNFIAGPDL